MTLRERLALLEAQSKRLDELECLSLEIGRQVDDMQMGHLQTLEQLRQLLEDGADSTALAVIERVLDLYAAKASEGLLEDLARLT